MNLRELDVGSTGITSVEPLRELMNLTKLVLYHVTGIMSLEPLSGRDIRIIGASPQLLATKK
jgi:hypothetical protein